MTSDLPFLPHGSTGGCEFKASPSFVAAYEAMADPGRARVLEIQNSFRQRTSVDQDILWTHRDSLESFWIRQRDGVYVMYRRVGGLRRHPTIELWHCGRYVDTPDGRRFDFEDEQRGE